MYNAHVLDFLYREWQIQMHFAVLRGTVADYQLANAANSKYAAEVWV